MISNYNPFVCPSCQLKYAIVHRATISDPFLWFPPIKFTSLCLYIFVCKFSNSDVKARRKIIATKKFLLQIGAFNGVLLRTNMEIFTETNSSLLIDSIPGG